MLQWHHKAVEPTGDQRSELWFYYHLGRIIREKLAGSTDPRDRPPPSVSSAPAVWLTYESPLRHTIKHGCDASLIRAA